MGDIAALLDEVWLILDSDVDIRLILAIMNTVAFKNSASSEETLDAIAIQNFVTPFAFVIVRLEGSMSKM